MAAQEDYWWEDCQNFQHTRHEFNPKAATASAIKGWLAPGYYANLTVLQLPDKEIVQCGYQIPCNMIDTHDFDLSTITSGYYWRTNGDPSEIAFGDGNEHPYEIIRGTMFPYVIPPSTDYPRGVWDSAWDRYYETSTGYFWGGAYEHPSQFGLLYNIMNKVHGIDLHLNLARIPSASPGAEPLQNGGWFVEYEGIIGAQLDIYQLPGDLDLQNGRLYHAGWLAFGKL